MAVIVFSSTKGGAGKTTACLLLATELALRASVVLIDADPNRPIRAWARDRKLPDNLSLVLDADEDSILAAIDTARRQAAFVLVDLEGAASKMILLATTRADLVLVPTQGSQLDAQQSARTLAAVRQAEEVIGRPIAARLLLTRTNPQIRTRTLSHLTRDFESRGVPVLRTELHDREAYRAMFSFRRALRELDAAQVGNLDRAVANAQAFAGEVVATLRAANATAAGSSGGRGRAGGKAAPQSVQG